VPNERRLDSAGPRIAIIGAGVSGLVCARKLHDRVCSVTVFEKSHGPGGRTATRRADHGLSFDHGAQYFTVRDSRFQTYIDQSVRQGIVAEWTGRIVQITGTTVGPTTEPPVRYVGVPGMTAIAKDLAHDIPISCKTHIEQIVRDDMGWQLIDTTAHRHSHFDVLVLALPAPQAALLLHHHFLASTVNEIQMTPCWALLVSFEHRIEVAWDGAFIHSSPLTWVARNSSKPGRDPASKCWVLHASSQWSFANVDQTHERVADELLAAFALSLGTVLPPAVHVATHRWMYSATPTPLNDVAIYDPNSQIAICGDWLAGGRVEGAFCSGLGAAEKILMHVEEMLMSGDGGI